MEKETKTAPVFEGKIGLIQMAVWKNTHETKEGVKFDTYKTTVQKRYTTNGKDWQTTYQFDRDELPKVALLLNKAYEWICYANTKGDNNE